MGSDAAAMLQRVVPPELLATTRSNVSGVWRKIFAAAGKYEPFSQSEKEVVPVGKITFAGDAPLQIKGGVHEQGRMVFRQKRPSYEQVSDLVVTPKGAGWKDGRLFERYSAGSPGLRILLGARQPKHVVETGCHIQCAHNNTYGDWVSEYLIAIGRARPLPAPLLLPAAVASHAYAQRDLSKLGVDYVSVEEPVLIRSATVLRQQKYFVHFEADEISALRALFGINPVEPKKGSIVYFSRRGEVSEVARRSYPHDVVERIVKEQGGRVIETARASPEDYEAVALEGETVIFDHGSAFYNALRWRPKRAIEIVSDAWWNNAFLMLANAMGVEDYTIIRGSLSNAHVENRLREALDRPLDQGGKT